MYYVVDTGLQLTNSTWYRSWRARARERVSELVPGAEVTYSCTRSSRDSCQLEHQTFSWLAAGYTVGCTAGCTASEQLDIQLPLYVPKQQQEPVQAGVVPVDPDEVHLPQLAQRLTAHMSGM